MIDGWDLGILIRLRRWHRLTFQRISQELISEVGSLKKGEPELKGRISKLKREGLIESEVENGTKFWKLTKNAYERFKGLKEEV